MMNMVAYWVVNIFMVFFILMIVVFNVARIVYFIKCFKVKTGIASLRCSVISTTRSIRTRKLPEFLRSWKNGIRMSAESWKKLMIKHDLTY